MPAHPRLSKQLTVAAFALSAVATVVLLFLIASIEPFERHENAPSVWWSILLWTMVGIGTWVVLLRLVILLLVPIAGILYRKSDGEAAGGPTAEESPTEVPSAPGGDSPSDAADGRTSGTQ